MAFVRRMALTSSTYTFGGRTWGLSIAKDQQICEALVERVDPLIVHTSPPCAKFSSLAPREGEEFYDPVSVSEAVKMVDFSIRFLERRLRKRTGGSFESPKGCRTWVVKSVLGFFGTKDSPNPHRYFALPDLCQFGLTEPLDEELYWR